MRRPFYSIPESAWLFPRSRAAIARLKPPEAKRKQLEEPVRQWCAYGLIRAYSIAITDICVEQETKVGSKNYRIDLAVLRDGIPWIVVECKKPGYKTHGKAMEQARSYVNDPIQAEYVLYTNGTEWHVERRVEGKWVPVPGIPHREAKQFDIPATELFRTLKDAAPVLLSLDERIQGKASLSFLQALQKFFYGRNELTQTADPDLRAAADSVLRAMVNREPQYAAGKISVARGHVASFHQRRNLSGEISDGFPGQTASALVHRLRLDVEDLAKRLEQAAPPSGTWPEVRLLRLLVALLQFYPSWVAAKFRCPRIPPEIHRTVRAWLGLCFKLDLGYPLPDTADTILTEDLRSYCEAWRQK